MINDCFNIMAAYLVGDPIFYGVVRLMDVKEKDLRIIANHVYQSGYHDIERQFLSPSDWARAASSPKEAKRLSEKYNGELKRQLPASEVDYFLHMRIWCKLESDFVNDQYNRPFQGHSATRLWLWCALENEHYAIADYLLAHGLDINYPDNTPRTVLEDMGHWVEYKQKVGDTKAIATFKNGIQYLISRGAKIA